MISKNIQNVTVIGAGFLGTQIGLQCASHGLTTFLVETNNSAQSRSKDVVQKELSQRQEVGSINDNEKNQILSRMIYTSNLNHGVEHAELIIEAIPEQLDLKREIFSQIDKIAAESTLIASNSSSIKISAIESATDRRDRVLNMHFYGMIWQRPMVELMRGTVTSQETIDLVYNLAQRIGVTPLVVDVESTGFIFNRVWRAIKRESLHLVNEGVTSHENVDRAWMIFTGMNIGPFAMMDRIGLDVICDIERVYYSESNSERDAPPPILTNLVEKGELGCKTDKGFYTYPNPSFEDPNWIRGTKS